METTVKWNELFSFTAKTRNHEIEIDTTLQNGSLNRGQSPKELLLNSVSACAGIDIVAILGSKKLLDLEIKTSAVMTKTKPSTFESLTIKYYLLGSATVEEAKGACIESMTKYCGVSAMFVKAFPIYYEVYLNGEFLMKDQSKFKE